MKKQFIIYLFALLVLLSGTVSCSRDLMEQDVPEQLPEGIPLTLTIPFGNTDMYEVEVGTKATSTLANESHVHDLYVMIFDTTQCIDDGTPGGSPRKIYGRYFSYDNQKGTIYDLDRDPNESWFVSNKTMDNVDNKIKVTETTGAVKVSTITCSAAKVVVLANVENAVMNMDGIDPLDRLKTVQHYNEMRGINVCLEQDIVMRNDLFLMTGETEDPINTAKMKWGTATYDGSGNPKSAVYSSDYKITLKRVDAKVKFRVKVNDNFISAVTPVYWQVCNTPDRCYLYSNYAEGAPDGASPFTSQQYYFEGKEVVDGVTYYTFSFYMLENREKPNGEAEEYYQRELREKIDSGEPGYKGPTGAGNEAFSNHYVDNGDWLFAPTFGTYVRFDLVLTLNSDGIRDIGAADPEGLTITQALTSDAIFTVHLGEFSSSSSSVSDQLNNYETKRGHSYEYTILINNTRSIYAEVKQDTEVQSGQEGFLLLTDSEIINADCHYEYHQIEFPYRPKMSQKKFSWYVKTPFGEGGPVITESNGVFSYNAAGLDYKWVLFGVNSTVPSDYTPGEDPNPDPVPWYNSITDTNVCPYTKKRHAYPGDNHYDPNWKPGQQVSLGVPVDYDQSRMIPDLMDITQLIQYIFYQTNLENTTGNSDFIADDPLHEEDGEPVIRVTAFIDEYYYLSDPTRPNAPLDPDLWRKFVNANPREMHILSDAQQSRDRKSDVILSSHSVIQQSIQTIYNIYAADLHSLWGTEHMDEMKEKSEAGWMYWPANPASGVTERSGSFSTMTGKENGRLNTAYIWRLYSKQDNSGVDDNSKDWNTFLNYDVNNNTPELREAYQGMAFSCMTRNRDNNGNGKIDRDEVRWYLAAPNQLIGMWVGNESLALDARLYRPAKNQWRAHIISSSDKRVAWSEEGSGATTYDLEKSAECWGSFEKAAAGESVRCLRNIGTYTDEETGLTDITNAPYKIFPERYFTITPDPGEILADNRYKDSPDTRYVFHFDRLNPKSLRELSETELPYSDQFSINNCVYLQMETQARVDEKILNPENPEDDPYPDFPYPFDLTMKEINPKVDQLGYNPFCPPGYRFPNESEVLLMSVYLPESYFTYGVTNDDSDKLPATWMTTRTFFDRGCYGKNTEGFEFDNEGFDGAKSREQGKVGFGYRTDSKKNSCSKVSFKTTRSRCVRDIDRTGDITGGILIKDELYPGDRVPLTFSFNSSGSTFISASLKFCYTDGLGTYHERDIPLQSTPSGLQYLSTQDYIIPTMASLGVTEDQRGVLKPKFKITLRNAYASKTFEQPFLMGNPLEGDYTLSGYSSLYPGGSKTMDFDFSTKASTCTLASVSLRLKYKDHSNADRVQDLSTSIPDVPYNSKTYTVADQDVPIPNLGTLELLAADLPRVATLEATVTDQGGSSKTITKEVTLVNPLQASITVTDATDSKIYPGDQNHATLSVESKASGVYLDNVALNLVYDEEAIPIELPSLGGSVQTYSLTNQAFNIPASLPGIDAAAINTGKSATLRLSYSAGGGSFVGTIDLPVQIKNPVSGTMTADTDIYPNDGASVTINFASAANTLNLSTATLQLYNGETLLHNFDLTGNLPSGKTYVKEPLALSIPALSALNVLTLDGTNFAPTDLTLKLTVSTAAELSHTAEQVVTMRSHINEADFRIQKGATIPINITTGLIGSTNSISSATLLWSQDNGENWNSETLSTSLAEQTVQTTSLTGFTPFVSNTSTQTSQSVLYKLTVVCSDGTSVTTPEGSMTVLDYGFEPNNTVFYSYQDNLHFSNGDFIEASIDITGKTSSDYNKDEMIGFGAGTDIVETFHTGTANNAAGDITLHVFYRTDLNDKNLRFGGWRGTAYKSTDVSFTVPDLVIRLDKDGIYYNEKKASLTNDLPKNLSTIIGSDHLLVGAAQGNQNTIRSNAHYNYINIARQPYQP